MLEAFAIVRVSIEPEDVAHLKVPPPGVVKMSVVNLEPVDLFGHKWRVFAEMFMSWNLEGPKICKELWSIGPFFLPSSFSVTTSVKGKSLSQFMNLNLDLLNQKLSTHHQPESWDWPWGIAFSLDFTAERFINSRG